ncbi:PilZ domain-containing protein [Novosphingobium sp. ZN18A2]|uniref:PilZ domain-containing protein n=1 Tax=Novosphingobium sp. ZN18A2 TaxID=3079861 RepID=UPI0030CB0DD8
MRRDRLELLQMPYFDGEEEVLQIERRADTRVLAHCSAELKLTTGSRTGRLTNISTGGVRLELADPPREGTTVMLEWKTFQMFCKVVWADNGACGLVFERPVSQGTVTQTSGQQMEEPRPEADLRTVSLGGRRQVRRGLPGAELGNIPLGPRRAFGRKQTG